MYMYKKIIMEALSENQYIAIAELHNSKACIKFIIDNLEFFHSLGVNYLFTEKIYSEDNNTSSLMPRLKPHDSKERYSTRKGKERKNSNTQSKNYGSEQESKRDYNLQEKDDKTFGARFDRITTDPKNYPEFYYTAFNMVKKAEALGIIVLGIDEIPPSSFSSNSTEACAKRARSMNKNAINVIEKTMSGVEAKAIIFAGMYHVSDYTMMITDEDDIFIKGIASHFGCKSLFIHEKRLITISSEHEGKRQAHHKQCIFKNVDVTFPDLDCQGLTNKCQFDFIILTDLSLPAQFNLVALWKAIYTFQNSIDYPYEFCNILSPASLGVISQHEIYKICIMDFRKRIYEHIGAKFEKEGIILSQENVIKASDYQNVEISSKGSILSIASSTRETQSGLTSRFQSAPASGLQSSQTLFARTNPSKPKSEERLELVEVLKAIFNNNLKVKDCKEEDVTYITCDPQSFKELCSFLRRVNFKVPCIETEKKQSASPT